jgi:hypothetical protein
MSAPTIRDAGSSPSSVKIHMISLYEVLHRNLIAESGRRIFRSDAYGDNGNARFLLAIINGMQS